jgi:hypothetical protein
MKANQLTQEEYAPWYANYIAKAGDNDLVEELEISIHRLIRFVQNIPMDKFDYRYAEGKWTIKDILQHFCLPRASLCPKRPNGIGKF